jgi:hypothetical protein
MEMYKIHENLDNIWKCTGHMKVFGILVNL